MNNKLIIRIIEKIGGVKPSKSLKNKLFFLKKVTHKVKKTQSPSFSKKKLEVEQLANSQDKLLMDSKLDYAKPDLSLNIEPSQDLVSSDVEGVSTKVELPNDSANQDLKSSQKLDRADNNQGDKIYITKVQDSSSVDCPTFQDKRANVVVEKSSSQVSSSSSSSKFFQGVSSSDVELADKEGLLKILRLKFNLSLKDLVKKLSKNTDMKNNNFLKILKEFNSNLKDALKNQRLLFKEKNHNVSFLSECICTMRYAAHLINIFIIIRSFLNSEVRGDEHVFSETLSPDNKLLHFKSNAKVQKIPEKLRAIFNTVMDFKGSTLEQKKFCLHHKTYKGIIENLEDLKKFQRDKLNNFINLEFSNTELTDVLKKTLLYFDVHTTKCDEAFFELLEKIENDLQPSCITTLNSSVTLQDKSMLMQKKSFMHKTWNKITKKFKELPNDKVHNIRTKSLYAVIAFSIFLMIACNDSVATQFFVGVMVIALLALALENYYYKLYGVDKSDTKKVPTLSSQFSTIATLDNGCGKERVKII